MHSFEQDIKKSVAVLEAGGVLLYPTDTVWGLGCDATDADAVSKIYNIKQRSDSKAMIVLVTGERDVIQYTASVDLSLFDYLETATRPTTVIYEHGIGFAENLTAADGSIAIRICRDEFCRALIKRFGKPIVSTSANISGVPAPAHFSAIADAIKKQADFVVEHRRDDQTPHLPSSIIRWKDGEVEVIR
ncbi:L-threonylcarbamoyladenylate synthase [Niabella aurantiaca]|uniref:L-threonylcarbamoyladenylate synthase n=1 Tax=Niabella aurantiaca TaxID=379900 RepID=UPI00035F0DA2|nr:L-threonylcarbamoyladenylate synthase [Niabella aurantiaca]